MITVLIVDDDFRVARIHRAFVDRVPGFAVLAEAHSGREALERIREHRPDLLLLDLYLPDMFGLEVLSTLRSEAYECEAIVITAASEADAVRSAVRLGVVNYLLKPFAAVDLTERLLAYARSRSELDRTDIADQATIDAALDRNPAAAEPRGGVLPKGLSSETLALVLADLPTGAASRSARESGAAVGVSRVTARRYLEHLVGTGQAEVHLRYGSSGRPERRFRRAPAP